eukprot:349757-Chlamydomonas_euryale.AAC.2
MDREDLDSRYVRVSPEDAEADWRAAYEAARTRCLHGADCRAGAACVVGRRLQRVTVLSGSVVRVWGVLDAVLSRHQH